MSEPSAWAMERARETADGSFRRSHAWDGNEDVLHHARRELAEYLALALDAAVAEEREACDAIAKRLVREAREACARAAEHQATLVPAVSEWGKGRVAGCLDIAAAVRARGQS